MKLLVMANQKGGVGKTTLTGHLAVEATKAGERVGVVDTDPQGSLASWWNERLDEAVSFVKLEALRQHLAQLKGMGFTTIIVDTPPAINDAILDILAAASLVVIPTRASPHDLRAVAGTVRLCEMASKRPVFIINGAAQRARITTQAAITLSEHGAVAPVVVYQRTDFASSMVDGRTAGELDAKSRSAAEIKQLWSWLSAQAEKGTK